ncbi:hypothetical protein GCM10025331_34670 [Actinoplanes utahensis]|nr:hypothetical protein Aut01nite_46750 [Actinoplanes utahensis]
MLPPPDGALVVDVGAAVGDLVRRFAVADVGWVDGRTVTRALGGGASDAEADADGTAGFDVVGCVLGAVTGAPSGASPVATVSTGVVVPGAAAVRRTSRSPTPLPATIVAEPAPIKPRAPTIVRV